MGRAQPDRPRLAVFFYGVTPGEATVPERIPYSRTPRRLPVILSADEVARFLEAVSSLESRRALSIAYAAGLRALEVAGLMTAEIDSARGVTRVRHGKGGKERGVMLSTQLPGILPRLFAARAATAFLFPGRDEDRPISPTVLHAAYRSAVGPAGPSKRAAPHTLRHSFATRLLRTAPTSASSKRSSATPVFPRRRGMLMSRRTSSGRRRVRSMA